MAWSTSELARLAATTVNTVRHYHRRGLLEHPERDTNGYKRYDVAHLVRLLQIRRLREIGVPIADISRVGPDVAAPAQVLQDLDAQLVETVERSLRARADIAAMLQHGSASGVPTGFEEVAGRLSTADRSLALIYSQLYDQAAMTDVREMMAAGIDDASTVELDQLTVDADEATRERLARDVAASMVESLRRYPWLMAPQPHLLRDERTTAETWRESVLTLYNPAQTDVIWRASRLATEQVATDAGGHPEPATTATEIGTVVIASPHLDDLSRGRGLEGVIGESTRSTPG